MGPPCGLTRVNLRQVAPTAEGPRCVAPLCCAAPPHSLQSTLVILPHIGGTYLTYSSALHVHSGTGNRTTAPPPPRYTCLPDTAAAGGHTQAMLTEATSAVCNPISGGATASVHTTTLPTKLVKKVLDLLT